MNQKVHRVIYLWNNTSANGLHGFAGTYAPFRRNFSRPYCIIVAEFR